MFLQAKALANAAERNAAWVGRARDNVDFSPKDAPQVAAFLSAERDARQVHRHSASLAPPRVSRCRPCATPTAPRPRTLRLRVYVRSKLSAVEASVHPALL